jgi:Skp family chaperone for outer membrane proteins
LALIWIFAILADYYYYNSKNLGRWPEWLSIAVSLGIVIAFAVLGSLTELAYGWFYIPTMSVLVIFSFFSTPWSEFVKTTANAWLKALIASRTSALFAATFALLDQSWIATIGFLFVFILCIFTSVGWIKMSRNLWEVTTARQVELKTAKTELETKEAELKTEKEKSKEERAKFAELKAGFATKHAADGVAIADLRNRLSRCADELVTERRTRMEESRRYTEQERISSEHTQLLEVQNREAAKRHSIDLARFELAEGGKMHARWAGTLLRALLRKGARSPETSMLIRDLASAMDEEARIGHVWVMVEDLEALGFVGTQDWNKDSSEWTERIFIMPKGIEEVAGRGPQHSMSLQFGDHAQVGAVVGGDVSGGFHQSVRINEDEAVRAAIRELSTAAEEPLLAEIFEEEYPEISQAIATVKESRNQNTVTASLKTILRVCREIGGAASPLLECALKVQQMLHGGVQ